MASPPAFIPSTPVVRAPDNLVAEAVSKLRDSGPYELLAGEAAVYFDRLDHQAIAKTALPDHVARHQHGTHAVGQPGSAHREFLSPTEELHFHVLSALELSHNQQTGVCGEHVYQFAHVS